MLVLALPYYLWRMWKRGGYGEGFSYRFGCFAKVPEKKPPVKRIWIQAVSVGEVLALDPLIERWSQKENVDIVLTTTTSTGFRLARERYANKVGLIAIFPLDFWPCSRNAWNYIQPDVIVLMESELWPEHLQQAASRQVPAILINARLSDRSHKRYLKLLPIARALLSPLTEVLAATELDGARYRKILPSAKRVTVTGSLKFDVDFGHQLTPDEITLWHKDIGFLESSTLSAPPLILLGSSTWPGEERMLLETLRRGREKGMNLRLLICPRHAERRNEIEKLLKSSGFTYALRSQMQDPGRPVDVYVADTTGELRILTQLADLVFIGKTMPPHHQGQTPIEAAAFARPTLFGPELSNFRDISRSLRQVGIAEAVADEESFHLRALELLNNKAERNRRSELARQWFPTNLGASARVDAALQQYL